MSRFTHLIFETEKDMKAWINRHRWFFCKVYYSCGKDPNGKWRLVF